MEYGIEQSPEDIVHDIDTLLRGVWTATNTDSPAELEKLSKAILQLPVLLNGLGYYLAMAEIGMDRAKDVLEYERDKALDMLMKANPKLAKNKAEVEVSLSEEHRKLTDEYFEAKKSFRLLKNKYDAVSKSFEGMRSRLSVIKNDLREA